MFQAVLGSSGRTTGYHRRNGGVGDDRALVIAQIAAQTKSFLSFVSKNLIVT